ncbi:unnamed protein product [Urochloa humidicola]
MMGAQGVCRSWRRAGRDEPELWRRIDMRGHEELAHRGLADLDDMAVDAVLRSRGQCQAFWGERAGDHDEFILFLGRQAPMLKSLILISCPNISDQGFMEAIEMFPFLEELEVSDCWGMHDKRVFEVIAKACPRLKHFRHCHPRYRYTSDNKDMEAMAVATMRELRSLQLFRNDLTNDGLAAILNNCPHLESLDIRNCPNVYLTTDIRAMCAPIKTKKVRYKFQNDFNRSEFEPGSPISQCSTCLMFPYFSNLGEDFDPDDYADFYDPSYGLNSLDEADFDVHDRALCKSLRRYLKMEWKPCSIW